MFGRFSSLGLRGVRNNSRYYNSNVHRRISRFQFIYNFVECFSRVKSIPWCGSWFLVRRHIMNIVNLLSMSIFCMSMSSFSNLSVVKEHFLQMNFSESISFDFQTNNESVRVQVAYLNRVSARILDATEASS